MKSKFITDLQDPSDSFGFLNAAGDDLYTSFSPPAASFSLPATQDVGSALDSNTVEIPSTPALTSEAVEASGAQSGPTSPVSLTSGGITINLLFDAAAMAAPASFRAGIQQAAALLTTAISDKITVNIKIDYSGTGGGAAAGPDNGLYESYASVRADLIDNATPGDTTFNALPSGSSFQGQSNVAVWNAQLKLWGLLGANDTTTDDGSATFATDINSNLLVGVALHELTHAMGRVPYGPPYAAQSDIFDFFRFTSPGTRLISGSSTAGAAYFSLDGGNTKLADYGQTSDPADFLNSGVQGPNDPFNEFYGGGTLQSLSVVDKTQLDALGFHTTVAQNGFVVAAMTSQAIQGGSAVTLLSGPPTITDPASTTLSSATIKIANGGGSAVTGDELYINGQQSGTVDGGLVAVSWNDVTKALSLVGAASIAAYQTLLSEITYQDAGTDPSTGSHPLRTTAWTVNDGAANIAATSQIAIERAPVVTAANVALNSGLVTVAASSLFTASDPDGDAITTYAFKDTGNGHFDLNGVAQANNQEIDVTAAQLSQLTYQNAVGTDSQQIRVSDGTLWSNWQSFTMLGPVATVIQTDGTTSLVQIGNNYFLNTVGSGVNGPELKYNGSPVYPGEFGDWMLIGAVQVSGGYDIAWKSPTGGYAVSNVDGNGNYLTDFISHVAGNNIALEQIETTFHQDLNGDGTIGAPTVVIQTDATTSLVQIGNNYFLNTVGSGVNGPELKYNGSPVYPGEFGDWMLIGAVQVSGGYDIAWKSPTGGYAVSNVDGNGNYLTDFIPHVAGNNIALEQIETTFHQDLNGDGTIGAPTVVIQTDATTSLVQIGNNYFLNTVGSGVNGPELKYNGSPVYPGEFGDWMLIGAVQVSGGYDIAWKSPTGGYAVSNVDGNGNYLTDFISHVAGNNIALEQIETTFHQDLNGDGTIGAPTVVIQTDATTSLVQIGNNYFLNTVGSGVNGPELKYNGSPVYPGEFGDWMLIGAVQVSGGYDIAWKSPTGGYAVSNVDGNGNYLTDFISHVAGNNIALEQIETTFHQDLNGDGTIGAPTVVIQTDATTSLVQIGNNYFLNTVGSGVNGPELKYNGSPVYPGEFGDWMLIGAVQVSGGYDIAWKSPTGGYAVSNVDGNGNYLTDFISHVAGNNIALEQIETTFHQDLNGDGTIGIPAGTTPITAQLARAHLTSQTGDSTILTLDSPSTFNSQIVGFTRTGVLAGSDQIDLRGLNYNSIHFSFDSSTDKLAVSDGSSTAKLQFLGQYSHDNFHFADDGNGGTIVYDAPTTNQALGTASQIAGSSPADADTSTIGEHDTFVFALNFGHVNLANFAPVTDTIQFSKSVFANIDSLLAATHDDVFGNAVITDAKHDTITIQHVTTAQLLTHQSDFYFV